MKEYLKFVRELADLIEDVGFAEALKRVEVGHLNLPKEPWEQFEFTTHDIPSYIDCITYRIKPATVQHPGGEMPQHVSREEFHSADSFYTPFCGCAVTRSGIEATYGDDAYKMAFDTAEKAKATEKVMRGF